MKIPLIPVALCCLGLVASHKIFDGQRKRVQAAEAALTSTRSDIAGLRSEFGALGARKSDLQTKAVRFNAFIADWAESYRNRYVSETVQQAIAELGEKSGVFVVHNKMDTVRLQINGTAFPGSQFTVRTVGPMSRVMRFIGELEQRYELIAIKDGTFTRGSDSAMDVSAELILTLPEFVF